MKTIIHIVTFITYLRTSNPNSNIMFTIIFRSAITKYRGPVFFRNSIVDIVFFPGGYATIDVTSVTFHYNTQE